jgi:choline dehydrogenase-like flavoprotein
MRHDCKVVVVGSGAGGAVAAATLAEAGLDTIIVEQGIGYSPSDRTDVVGGLSEMYVNAGLSVAFGLPPIPIPLGCGVGGTTTINSSTCFRPPRDQVAAWGGPTYEALEPFMAKVEQRINAVPADVGLLGGNWRVMKRGCDALGLEIKPLVHNVRECRGRGRCAFGCPTGAKQSMDRTFIPDALAAGARLLAGHRVERVLIKGGRAAGVAGVSGDGRFTIQADAVVLAMGALAGAAFLLKHRLANSSGCVGRGLHIHPACRVVAEFDEIVDGHVGMPQGAYIDRWADRGIMLEGIFVPPGLLISSLPGVGAGLKTLAAAYRRLSAFGVMVSDTTSGRVLPSRLGLPSLTFYQASREDAEHLRFGIARLAEIYLAAGARRVFTGFSPRPEIYTRDDLARFEAARVKPTDFELLAFHPLGTCRMGADPKTSVVSYDLETHDVPRLCVMDGGVIPSPPGVNPQITIMTLAMCAATRLAETLR